MFLLRAAFGLAVIVMLLPTDEAQQAKIVGSAGIAAERAATFCERNAATCAAGAELWATFLKKAEFGAKLAGNLVQDYMRGSVRSAGGDPDRRQPLDPSHLPRPAPASSVIDPSRGTLSTDDLAPAWRGGVTRTGT